MKPSNVLVRSEIIALPDLGAGVDIVGEVGWVAPAQGARIQAVRVIFREATVGVDGANPLTVDLLGPLGQFATTGALVANQAAGVVLSPAVGPAANANLTAAQALTFNITQGATANIGRAEIQIDYIPLVS